MKPTSRPPLPPPPPEQIAETSLALSQINHIYKEGAARVPVLQGANLTLYPGEMVALVAPSGAGKSTLLHIAGLLEKPTAGQIYIAGKDCSALTQSQCSERRRMDIGFVYQFHHLLPEFTALENVMIPQLLRGLNKREARHRAEEILSYMKMEERLTHRPYALSGGERQRVAIARAVANAPKILLADEPTGNLDLRTSDHVFTTLSQLVRQAHLTALIATHNLDLVARMDRCLTIFEGKIFPLNHETLKL